MSFKKDSFNYMDAVNVKIAEEYKPPRKINMIMTHAQRLSLNKQLENNLQTYDFTLEKHLLARMKEWKNNRIINCEQRKFRLELLKEKELEIEESSSPEEVPLTTTENESDLNKTGSNYTYSNGLLLPIKVSNYYDGQKFQSEVKSPFNISEFEADTSSPFDNVALKSINDVEELAKVLKIDDLAPTTSTYSNYITPSLQTIPNNYTFTTPSYNSHTMNGYHNIQTSNSFPLNYQVNTNILPNSNFLATTKLENKKTDQKSVFDDLPSPYDELPKHLQELSKRISSMGFPLSRVARACRAIGDDNKKVLDHLLALTELLDLGFDEIKVSEALLMFDNDRDKALDKLIS